MKQRGGMEFTDPIVAEQLLLEMEEKEEQLRLAAEFGQTLLERTEELQEEKEAMEREKMAAMAEAEEQEYRVRELQANLNLLTEEATEKDAAREAAVDELEAEKTRRDEVVAERVSEATEKVAAAQATAETVASQARSNQSATEAKLTEIRQNIVDYFGDRAMTKEGELTHMPELGMYEKDGPCLKGKMFETAVAERIKEAKAELDIQHRSRAAELKERLENKLAEDTAVVVAERDRAQEDAANEQRDAEGKSKMIRRVGEKMAAVQGEKDNLLQGKVALELEVADNEAKIARLESELAQLRSAAPQNTDEIEMMTNEKGVLEAEKQQLSEQLLETQEKIAALEQENITLQAHLSHGYSTFGKWDDERVAEETRLRDQLQAHGKEIAGLEAQRLLEVTELREQRQAHGKKIARLEAQLRREEMIRNAAVVKEYPVEFKSKSRIGSDSYYKGTISIAGSDLNHDLRITETEKKDAARDWKPKTKTYEKRKITIKSPTDTSGYQIKINVGGGGVGDHHTMYFEFTEGNSQEFVTLAADSGYEFTR